MVLRTAWASLDPQHLERELRGHPEALDRRGGSEALARTVSHWIIVQISLFSILEMGSRPGSFE